MGGQASILGDVYSYGILLLELFTGISPIDNKFKEGLSLHMYTQMAFPEQVMDIVDNRMFSAEDNIIIKEDDDRIIYQEESVRDCLVSVIKYGLICSSASPKDRLEMTEIANELNEAKGKFLRTKSPNKAQSRPRTLN